MGTAAAVAALVACAIGRSAGVSSRGERDYFAKPSQNFDPQDFPRFALTGHKEPRPEHDPRAVFYIPVKFGLERAREPAARRLAPDRSYDADSPRLIMDEDFNIRFDNPYIVPLTKPLALVLDTHAAARARSGGQEKMMIPFPVLVKARKPLLDGEGFRDYRDEDDTAEHRSVDFDDAPAPAPAKPPKVGKKWKNATAARAKKKVNTLYSLEDDYKPGFADSYNVSESDLYPGKIFAEMYRNMPVFDSEESREEPPPPPRYAPSSTSKPRASSETSPPWRPRAGVTKYPDPERLFSDAPSAKAPRASSEANPPWRPRAGVTKYPDSERLFSDAPNSKASRASSEASPPWRPRPGVTKFPGSERLFSASTDLEWVTQANSTKARTPPSARDGRESRIVIRDVNPDQEDQLVPATTTTTTTTTASPEVTISRKFWRTF